MRTMVWEVKVSKLCNLRCTYCYEFYELADPRRLSLENWRAILESILWYHEELERRGEPVVTQIIWHGGEPLLLPLPYYRSVVALEGEVFGDRLNKTITNHIPTNLFKVPAETLAFLRAEQFRIVVSFDAISGVRVDGAGKPTEQNVEANIRRLLADGWTLGCDTVLGRHNAAVLPAVYDKMRDISQSSAGQLYFNVLPLHGTPTDDGHTAFSLPASELADAMFHLFVHWTEEEERTIDLWPIETYYLDVVRKLRGLPREYFDRREFGESALIVNTDGRLYSMSDFYDPARSLGSLFTQSLAEIMSSPAYAASLDRDEARLRRYCGTCPYDGYCNHQPLINGRRDEPGDHCSLGFPLHQKIESWLVERGFDQEGTDAALPHFDCLVESESA